MLSQCLPANFWVAQACLDVGNVLERGLACMIVLPAVFVEVRKQPVLQGLLLFLARAVLVP